MTDVPTVLPLPPVPDDRPPVVLDDGFADGLANLDSFFAAAPLTTPAAPTPIVRDHSLDWVNLDRRFCEGCRHEVDQFSADTVTAVQQIGGRTNTIDGLARMFHRRCWNDHDRNYRRT